MVHDVPGYGMRWLTTQHPACEFNEGDIKTVRKYLKMLHKQGLFRFVNECETYSIEGKKCVGFCVEEGAGCGNSAGMITDIADKMYDTDVGKNTPFDLAQVDMMRMRILMVNITNRHYAGHRAVSLDCVYDMCCKIEEGRNKDEKEEISEVRDSYLSKIYKSRRKKY